MNQPKWRSIPQVAERYMRVFDHVTDEPRSATEVYRSWAGLPEWKGLTRSMRENRRWVAKALDALWREDLIIRHINQKGGQACLTFSRKRQNAGYR